MPVQSACASFQSLAVETVLGLAATVAVSVVFAVAVAVGLAWPMPSRDCVGVDGSNKIRFGLSLMLAIRNAILVDRVHECAGIHFGRSSDTWHCIQV